MKSYLFTLLALGLLVCPVVAQTSQTTAPTAQASAPSQETRLGDRPGPDLPLAEFRPKAVLKGPIYGS